MRFALLPALLLAGAACGPRTSANLEELETRRVTLPDGAVLRAEAAVQPQDLARGLMFRESLAPDRGMLFVHPKPGTYPYWMFNTRIPLDIIWMDGQHRIVEISADTPPCKTPASECPQYGGHYFAEFVLELAAGQAARHHLRLGQTLGF